jgi:hypothetical protein
MEDVVSLCFFFFTFLDCATVNQSLFFFFVSISLPMCFVDLVKNPFSLFWAREASIPAQISVLKLLSKTQVGLSELKQ